MASPATPADRGLPGAMPGRSRLVPWLLAAPLLVGLAVFALYPFLDILALSLSKSSLGRPFQHWPILANFLSLARSEEFHAALLRTTIFAVPVSLAELVLGLGIALLLHSSLREARWVHSLILLPLMTPPMMVAVAWKLILAPVGGLLNGVLLGWGLADSPVSFLGTMPAAFLSIAVADTWQWTPFIAILAYAALQVLPDEVFEAARVDGASPAKMFWYVTLPMLAPTLLAIFLLRVVMAFKLFDLVYGLTFGGPGFSTTVASFKIWRTALQEFDVGLAASQTLVFAVLVSLVTLPITWLHRRSEEWAG
ncbi:carbohydrate ABC transporter permease [Labrys monachus]|uniref:Multiple sugar transport system permease protein n=1 Tax=Labrys monachus TaxID=217067 RepID=A0ABU0FG55_9HYPH|nr:sugar ABC transporter permease [Labrys monachus]MDQ0393593.1 multiple sugar transport system permease protein [Labrys monachus]